MHGMKAAFCPCSAWSSSAMATFQQPLLIEQRSRTKFSTSAYSYQPNNTVRPFQTDPEEHSRSSGRLGAKHSPRRRRGRARAPCPRTLVGDTPWDAPCMGTASGTGTHQQGLIAPAVQENTFRYIFRISLAHTHQCLAPPVIQLLSLFNNTHPHSAFHHGIKVLLRRVCALTGGERYGV